MTEPVQRLTAFLAERYRVERKLGEGGMATVYLAEDLKHGRRVALKVLHPELAAVLGGERFLAEIKTTAHLQHPNILQLFDSGDADGLLYYVMPFVEGESLRGRLTREKQLPVQDAVAIARGVAAALDYAHRHGVIHRDIKPENILLQDGQPLVADFGIALAVKQAGGARLTQTGLSLGTPQYMSPEQATAERELDARSDVYALGAVAYEMLGGEAPFTGTSTQAIIAKLMTEEPRRLSLLRKAVPPHVEAAVHQAMEKLPADRFGSAAEFAAALADGRGDGQTGRRADGITKRGARRPAGMLIAGAGLIAAAALLLGRWSASAPPAVLLPSRLAILPPPQTSLNNYGVTRTLDISQDGRLIAFATTGPASSFVALRRLEDGQSSAMPNSDGVLNLRLSPDGRYLISPRGTATLQRAPVGGGAWTPIPAVPATAYTSWDRDGAMWWSPLLGGGIYRARPGAEKSETPFASDTTGFGPVIQQMLPDGRRALVVFSAASNSGLAGIRDMRSGETRNLFDFPVVEIRYTAGVLMYARPDNSLHAVSFDLDRGVVTGEPVLLAFDVAATGTGVAQFAVSGNGTVVYLPSLGRELVVVDRNGAARSLLDQRLNLHSPRFSPDGRLIALDNSGSEGRDVWIFDREQQQLTRSTFERDGHDPVWSADGRFIYYASARSGALGIHRVRPGGGGKADSIFAQSQLAYTGSPLGAGDTLLTVANELNGRSGADIALIHGTPRRLTPLLATPFEEGWAVPSPDGKWVAFTTTETGRQEVYLYPLSGEGIKVQVSVDGGSEPVWSRSGRELFYRRPAGGQVQLVAAEVQLGTEARVVRRTALFDVSDHEPAQPHANYDVAPDGQSFVMLRRSPASHLVVIQNVQELVRRAQGPK